MTGHVRGDVRKAARERAATTSAAMTKGPDESQTAFTIRCIQAQAWDEGATKASPHGGGYLRSILIENPYRTIHDGQLGDA